MTYRYRQSTGEFWQDATLLGVGYSGFGLGKNNPALQDTVRVGPLPAGRYGISGPTDTQAHGAVVFTLTPDKSNTMHGRSGFLIHGDSRRHPGQASNGCIILDLALREAIARSTDRSLVVSA